MDLRQFVKESLVQIVGGAQDSAEEVRKSGGIVNPAVSHASGRGKDGHFATLDNGASIFLADFDVAVTVLESDEAGGQAKAGLLKVFSAEVGGKMKSATESISRVRFKIPLAFAVDPQSEADRKKKGDIVEAMVRALTFPEVDYREYGQVG